MGDAARRLAELDAERERLLEEQRREALAADRNNPIALKKLAEEMGVKLGTLVAAAKRGDLVAWRLGGARRGELVTTREELDKHLRARPAKVVLSPDASASEMLKAAAARSRPRVAKPKR